MASRRTLKRVGLALAVFVVGPPLAGSLHQAFEDATFVRRFTPPGTLVDIGGRRIHVHCEGEGAPTVVLTHGLAGSSVNWAVIAPQIATHTRTCVWDRAGYGWSPTGADDGRASAGVDDLIAWMDAAGETEPIVFAGHSFASFLVRGLHARQPERLLAAVVADPAHPSQLDDRCEPSCLPEPMPLYFRTFFDRLPSMARSGFLRFCVFTGAIPVAGDRNDLPSDAWWTLRHVSTLTRAADAASREVRDWSQTAEEARAQPDLGSLPWTVISAEDPFGTPPQVDRSEVRAVWPILQADIVEWSSRGQHAVRAGADHNDLITSAPHARAFVEAVLAQVRAARGD